MHAEDGSMTAGRLRGCTRLADPAFHFAADTESCNNLLLITRTGLDDCRPITLLVYGSLMVVFWCVSRAGVRAAVIHISA